MSKIKTLTVSNLKAVSQQTADFNGCTAIITGGNNRGKTSFLRSLFDRVRGIKPDKVLHDGETEGFAEATLTTGEKIKWEFNDKGKGFKEKLTYITEKDIRTPLSVELRNRFFPETFDVDSFLAAQPKKQREILQDLAGLDFTSIDARYKTAYEARTAANTLASNAATLFGAAVMPEKVIAIDLTTLQAEKEEIRKGLIDTYLANKKVNDEARTAYNVQIMDAQNEFNAAKLDMDEKNNKKSRAHELLRMLTEFGYVGSEVKAWVESLPFIKEVKMRELVEPAYIPELPDNAPLLAIETKIEAAHQQNRDAATYNAWVALQTKKNESATIANEADEAVKVIEQERMDLIKTANMPQGFSFTDEGIAYNGMAFTREQLSSSGIYIAALKLASMKMGEVRCLHFDASFLDNNSLAEIEKWANEQDLQLLIEQPDRSGGEIEYQLITT